MTAEIRSGGRGGGEIGRKGEERVCKKKPEGGLSEIRTCDLRQNLGGRAGGSSDSLYGPFSCLRRQTVNCSANQDPCVSCASTGTIVVPRTRAFPGRILKPDSLSVDAPPFLQLL